MANVSPLLQALYEGRSDDVEALRAEQPELDGFEAAALGDAARLAEVGDPQAWSVDGFTQLHLAAFFGHLEAARLLVQRGAAVGAVSRNTMLVQPLHSAAASGQVEIARLLLEAGADPNAVQQDSYTPLMAAEQSGNTALAQLLRSHGAASSSES